MRFLTNFLRRAAGLPSHEQALENVGTRPLDQKPVPAAVAEAPAWPNSEVLMSFGADPWRLKDAVEGTIVIGETGCGKSSGSGVAFAHTFLRAGFGGLVLCVKEDEPRVWEAYAKETGRSEDLILFGEGSQHAFNFLNYEARRPGVDKGLTENIVNLITEVSGIDKNESQGGKGEDPIWEKAVESLTRNLVDLLQMAGEDVTLHRMMKIILSAPKELGSVKSMSWQASSACWAALQTAEEATRGKPEEIDYEQVANYWLNRFPDMPEKMRGSILEMFVTMAESLMRGKTRELFCSGTTVIPEHILAGKIVVVALPTKKYDKVGKFAGVLWKYLFQKAVERRTDNQDGCGRPVFLWADEFQAFYSRYDPLFQQTARSSRVATVYLTQNLPNLVSALGGESKGKANVDSLLGNLGTKIWHANGDKETNHWAAETIGKTLVTRRSFGKNSGFSTGQGMSFNDGRNEGGSEQIDYQVQPHEFTILKKGGPENGCVVEGIIYQTGRVWTTTGATWQRILFRQPVLKRT